MINKNIEAEMIARASKEKPGLLSIAKEVDLKPGEQRDNRKKKMRHVQSISEQHFDK
jgi:hypothetical protein